MPSVPQRQSLSSILRSPLLLRLCRRRGRCWQHGSLQKPETAAPDPARSGRGWGRGRSGQAGSQGKQAQAEGVPGGKGAGPGPYLARFCWCGTCGAGPPDSGRRGSLPGEWEACIFWPGGDLAPCSPCSSQRKKLLFLPPEKCPWTTSSLFCYLTHAWLCAKWSFPYPCPFPFPRPFPAPVLSLCSSCTVTMRPSRAPGATWYRCSLSGPGPETPQGSGGHGSGEWHPETISRAPCGSTQETSE